MSVKDDGVGIPKENPNLTPEIQEEVDGIYKKIKEGMVVVESNNDLNKFIP